MTTDRPFAAVEACLLHPAADGVMVTHLVSRSPMASAGWCQET